MQIVIAAGLLAVAAVLIAGALGKLVTPGPFKATLAALGLPSRAWLAVPFAEVAAAALLLIRPGWTVSQLAALAVFACFAAAGVSALVSGRTIACACFGAAAAARLGVRQLVQLVPVAALLAFLRAEPMSWDAQEGVALLVATLATAAVAHGARAIPLWRQTREERLSLRETRVRTRRLALEESHG